MNSKPVRMGANHVKTEGEMLKETLKIMSICHDCEVIKDPVTKKISYNGISADEITLVDAAKRFGYEYSGGNEQKIFLNVFGEPYEMDLLHKFKYSSDTKI